MQYARHIIKVVLFFVLIFLSIYYFSYVYSENYENKNQENQENDEIEDDDYIPTVSFPFKNLYDDRGKKLNIILLSAPFRERKHEKLYEEYMGKGLDFAGISSYLEFPGKIQNPYEDRFHERRKHNYLNLVSSWIHCFREPNKEMVDSKLPLLMLTEADLKDTTLYVPNKDIKKEYDFIYICLKDNDQCTNGWQSYNRNWDLAKKCLEVMCEKYKLKGVLVGRENCEFTNKCNGIVKVVPFLQFHEFQREIQKCNFIFAPNISDASPRVITEALCYNVPALVNYNIFGGWHNIIPGVTGEFFTDEKNIIPALDKLLTNYKNYKPREWYVKNRGLNNSGKILSEFLIANYPNINNKKMKYAYVTI